MKKTVPIWDDIFIILNDFMKGFELPSVSLIGEENGTPYKILISTLISLRTRDEVTLSASRRLFEKADNPAEMLKLTSSEIEELIYPCGFFRVKADNILKISQMILNEHSGKVPCTLDKLIAFPGVGLKTANLVLSLGFNIPAICVDIHVHRISNRLGWIKTKKPDDSVPALEKVLPDKYWIPVNKLLVLYGQQICTPRNPKCSQCPLDSYCLKAGVEQSR
ncbi:MULTISPECIES: endonuclease III [unclassified Oceanispirochaeta]|uniref:endonuclease III domain-containing protein n=1 Tax=unclassified Oceanispirochaeta TaxID=2635722 RepID=UPI000E08E127|nr:MULTISPECIES: endonuclease III [unclassified Oceanispirochaeta]MBF9015414.1 endonuclease III [Oceanispirochaeta sp. M2]NPD71873.1 endonuclease III [Oceanispirochaeta sp. M1]RDG32682.1 endonuclease III [Oceanispirochaeta sp. M1]